jgi:hypothetical protein
LDLGGDVGLGVKPGTRNPGVLRDDREGHEAAGLIEFS